MGAFPSWSTGSLGIKNKSQFLSEPALLLLLYKNNFIEAKKHLFLSDWEGQSEIIWPRIGSFVVGMECQLDTVLASSQVPPDSNN